MEFRHFSIRMHLAVDYLPAAEVQLTAQLNAGGCCESRPKSKNLQLSKMVEVSSSTATLHALLCNAFLCLARQISKG